MAILGEIDVSLTFSPILQGGVQCTRFPGEHPWLSNGCSEYAEKTEPRGNCTQTSHLETGQSQMEQFEMPRLPCFELHRLD